MIIQTNAAISGFLKTSKIVFYVSINRTSIFSAFTLYKWRQYATRLLEVAFLGAVFITGYKFILENDLNLLESIIMSTLFLFYTFLIVNFLIIKKKGLDKVKCIERIRFSIISTPSTCKEIFSLFARSHRHSPFR